jgi:hypothetical protein
MTTRTGQHTDICYACEPRLPLPYFYRPVSDVGGVHLCHLHAKAWLLPELVNAAKAALLAPVCPLCGRDNTGDPEGCTRDDCPGVAAIAKYEEASK